jgi:NAD(P)-dependent dehydrogenase (short-subunit alcohol dehydrogenase family)
VAESLHEQNPEGQHETYALDLSDSAALDKFIRDVLEKHKAIDVLVNNAGMGPDSHPLEGISRHVPITLGVYLCIAV